MLKTKKILSIILALAMILSSVSVLMSLSVSADTLDIWDGTTQKPESLISGSSPYLINTPEEFAWVLDNANAGTSKNKSYKLTADIYLNDITKIDWSTGTPVAGYTPRSWSPNSEWYGTIDGDGHAVYGLYINNNPSSYNASTTNGTGVGLISKSYGGKTTTFKNFGLDYIYLNGANSVSPFVANFNSSGTLNFDSCFVGENTWLKGYAVGGFVAYNSMKVVTNITNCYVTVPLSHVTVTDTKGYGAFIGSTYNPSSGKQDIDILKSFCIGMIFANNTPHSTNNTYATVLKSSGWGTIITEAQMKGASAKTNMPSLDWNKFVTTDSFPQLKIFYKTNVNFHKTAVDSEVLTVGCEQTVADLDIPKIQGYKVEGIYYDADYTQEAKENDPLYEHKDIYLKWINEKDSIWDGSVATDYADGDGSQANPYQISNGSELAKILDDVQKGYYYVITDDIYLNDVSNPDWKDVSPISWRYVENYFRGTIDGADHTIYGLYYNGDKKVFGLVNRIDGETVFKNLRISDSYIKTNGGTTSDDTLIGTTVFAGFAKTGATFTAENCYVSDSVSISGVKGVGTFCGYGSLAGFNLTNCATFATITASKYAGSFAGGCWGSNHSYTNCIAGTGNTLNNKLKSDATGCYTNFSGSEAYEFSGLIKITDTQMKGAAAQTNMPDLDWTNVWETTENYPILKKNSPEIIDPDGPIEGAGEKWEDFAATSYAGGDGTQSNPYKISNAEQLAHLIKDSNTNGKYYVITTDIQLNKTSSKGFGSKRNWFDSNQNSYYFQGNLDGKNHIISGLYYYNGDVTSSKYSALIPRTKDNAVISNIILKNSSITMVSSLPSGSDDFSSVAAIVAHANGNTVVNNCYVEKTVVLKNICVPDAANRNARLGGIIGAGSKSVYVNSSAFLGDITVTDTARYGSVFGDVWGNSTYTKEINKSIAVKYTPSSNYAFTGSNNIFEVASSKTSKGYVVSGLECDVINKSAIKEINDSFYLTESGYPKPCGIGNRFCDVDGDLATTSDDAALMRRLLLEVDTLGCININGDDSADIADLVHLENKLSANPETEDPYNNVPEDMVIGDIAAPIELKSATITMYDVASNTYGVTWNSDEIPIDPVIQVCESPLFDSEHITEYAVTSTKYSSYSDASTTYDYYVSKGIITLSPDKTYTYRAYDKSKGIASKTGTIKTQSHNTDSFTFMHFSDSQVSGSSETNPGTSGSHFAKTLSAAVKNDPNMAFAVHTGDIVEWSKYEAYWENMLDKYNSDYFMSIPFMPISGNHETTYRNGSNETFKHFNLNLPSQDTTKGIYYSYDYGNTRFIMLNTNRVNSDKTLTSDQYNWLVDTLDSRPSSIKWTIVSMHCPMYSVGKYGSNSSNNAASIALKNQLSKLFADKDVDLVLQGHDHEYSKTKPIVSSDTVDTSYTTQTIGGITYDVNPNGTVYAMNGPAGTQTRSPESSVNTSLYDYYNTSATKQHSFAKVSVDGNKLTVEIMYESGGNATSVYSYGIMKD